MSHHKHKAPAAGGTPGLAPRRAAISLIGDVMENGRLLSQMLPAAVEHLAPEERARATRLATSTLRWSDRADRMLGPYLRKRPPLAVHNLLRLGVVEIFEENGAAHGVVNACVSLAGENRGTSPMAGLINAVLRKVAKTPVQEWQALPVPRLPKWLRKVLLADYGKNAVLAMEKAHAAGAPLDLSCKSDAELWADRLGGELLPVGSVCLGHGQRVSALDGFDAGAWWVQDAAAALPARLLRVRPQERVLDMCAAPGGKTMQLAAAGADVTALDLSSRRMARVSENLARTGLHADTVVADALTFEAPPFDAILLDAPCSATGTIRRHPDLPHAKTGEDFPALFDVQARMLDRALALLRPGGRLVYCTCSLLIDEGEEQIRDLQKRMPGVQTDDAALAHLPQEWRVPEGLRTRPDYWPERGGMDGFFIAALRKPA